MSVVEILGDADAFDQFEPVKFHHRNLAEWMAVLRRMRGSGDRLVAKARLFAGDLNDAGIGRNDGAKDTDFGGHHLFARRICVIEFALQALKGIAELIQSYRERFHPGNAVIALSNDLCQARKLQMFSSGGTEIDLRHYFKASDKIRHSRNDSSLPASL